VSEAENANMIIMAEFGVWNIGSTTINWLSPDPEVVLEKIDSNNRSIVFKLEDVSGVEIMFSADAEIELENALIKKYCSDELFCPTLQSNYSPGDIPQT